MNLFVFFALALLLIGSTDHVAADDFRGFSWGTPVNHVRRAIDSGQSGAFERGQLLFLVERSYVLGYTAEVLFVFNENDQLSAGMIVFLPASSATPTTWNLHRHNEIKRSFEQRYGMAADYSSWTGRKGSSSNEIANALVNGRVSLVHAWATEDTVINLRTHLDGQTSNIDTFARFQSYEHPVELGFF